MPFAVHHCGRLDERRTLTLPRGTRSSPAKMKSELSNPAFPASFILLSRESKRLIGPGTPASNSSVASFGCFIHLKKRCFRSLAAVGRLSGSVCRHNATTSLISCRSNMAKAFRSRHSCLSSRNGLAYLLNRITLHAWWNLANRKGHTSNEECHRRRRIFEESFALKRAFYFVHVACLGTWLHRQAKRLESNLTYFCWCRLNIAVQHQVGEMWLKCERKM